MASSTHANITASHEANIGNKIGGGAAGAGAVVVASAARWWLLIFQQYVHIFEREADTIPSSDDYAEIKIQGNSSNYSWE